MELELIHRLFVIIQQETVWGMLSLNLRLRKEQLMLITR